MIEQSSTNVAVNEHITTVTSTTELLAVFILFLVVGTFASLAFVHIFTRDVNPISEAVSDYGVGETRWFYRLAAIWLGLAGLLMAVMLGDALFPKPTLVILLLLVFAATRWAITIFPVDLPGEEQTSVGHSHTVLAVLAFASIATAAMIFPLNVADDRFWDGKTTLLWILGGLVAATAIGTGLTRRAVATRYFGLVERLLYLAMFAWLSGVSLILLTG